MHAATPRSDKARKRLAVPFRAAHTPAERSEYAQPDVALLLTHLATYHSGLSEAEMREAVAELLQMGPSAQEEYYRAWLDLAQGRIDPGGVALAQSGMSQSLDQSGPTLSQAMLPFSVWDQYAQ